MGQGEKFDTDGRYVRRWVPKLARLPAAGVTLGQTYPRPIVDHAFARDRALQALKHTRPEGAAD